MTTITHLRTLTALTMRHPIYRYLTGITTILLKNYRDNCEKPCCSGSHKQYKTLFKDHMARLKIMALYIHKDLRLGSNESCDHYHEDGNLVPSPRCGFSFEAAFRLKINHYFPVNLSFFHLCMHRIVDNLLGKRVITCIQEEQLKNLSCLFQFTKKCNPTRPLPQKSTCILSTRFLVRTFSLLKNVAICMVMGFSYKIRYFVLILLL